MQRYYGWKFVATVALPLFIASLSVAVLTFDLLSRVSTGANEEDRKRTREVVQSALSAEQKQLANLTTDNSLWDDAVRFTSGEVKQEWVHETWGLSSGDGINYDLYQVIERSAPKPLAGSRHGETFTPARADYFGGQLDVLLDQLPKDESEHGATAGLVRTPDGLAIAAVAPILPISENMALPDSALRYLVYVRFLTPEYVAHIGEQYVVNNLEIAPADETRGGTEVIQGVDGAAVGALRWRDRRPGDVAGAVVSKTAMLVLGFLALVMAGIGLLCWRLIGRIAAREAMALHDAQHDGLTGLPNRQGLTVLLNEHMTRRRRNIVVAFIDLDGFKEVNDAYDHETGDRLIRAVAAGLLHLAPKGATVSRLGGDEFVAVFEGENAVAHSEAFCRNLQALLAVPFDFEGRIASVGASIGLASTVAEPIDAAELMRRADIAMYRAKRDGRNRTCAYCEEFDAERADNKSIAAALRRIIATGSIEVRYQPVVDARMGGIVGVEALARWPSTVEPHVSTDRFIRVAENSGLIDALGAHILDKACREALNWPTLQLAVNVSPVQLRNPDFVNCVLQVIRSTGIDPRRIELEMTESILVDDVTRVKRMFSELRAAGVQIALDDFGTGFSSIGYLRAFEFDRIKIDRSLVDHILSGSCEQSIIQGTMLMASGLTARVTAEGVEMEDQVKLLRLTGCTEMQGHFFFEPLPAAAITEILNRPSNALSAA